jgi:hypothetical protein
MTPNNFYQTTEIFDFIDREVKQCNSRINSRMIVDKNENLTHLMTDINEDDYSPRP